MTKGSEHNEQASALFMSQEGMIELEDQTLEEIRGAGLKGFVKQVKMCFGCAPMETITPRPALNPPPSLNPRPYLDPPSPPSPPR